MAFTVVNRVRSQYDPSLIGVGAEPIRLSWQVGGTGFQRAAELQMSRDPSFASVDASLSLAGPDQIAVPAPGPAPVSRARYHYRVRVDASGEWTPWSEPLTVEFGLLNAADWNARAITLPDDGGERPS